MVWIGFCVDDEDFGSKFPQVRQRIRNQMLSLHIQAEGLQGGESFGWRSIGEEHDASHSHPSVAGLP